jgi:ElaB/YqjD/DUF883 family membrane-anchored ribosome-binding protein
VHNQEHGIDQAANRIQDKVSDFGSKVGDVADAAERKGAKIVEGIENAASTVRDRLDDTVSYFRDNDARRMADDLTSYVKSHPAQALIGAIAIGFFAGRMIRRP